MKAKILAISLLSFASIVLASCTTNNGGNSLEPSNSTSKVDAFEEFKNETLKDNEVRINLRKSKAVLRWKPVTNATGYNVYVSDSTFGEYDAFNSGPITKTNFDNGVYPFGYYKVTAIVNDKEVPINDEPVSVFSNTLTVTDNDMFRHSLPTSSRNVNPSVQLHRGLSAMWAVSRVYCVHSAA